MAIKKSELYSKLWASCDELRGGMDASQYKDYVLVFLFIKYVSDKYAGQPYAPITIPKGASFKDMVALKGKSDIGDQINKKIIAPLAKENKLSDMPDFNDANKLGSGKDMVERLTNLIAIFEDKNLDFSKNRADGDDILGDAYEYLMRHFATESGKSKGQFYTPAEVSRIMAQILGIKKAKVNADTTVYDPTCGSGSLLLKVADEASTKVSIYGQEKDATTSGLARMNMILHNNPTAMIVQGNTLSDPKFLDGSKVKQFDYVVANPPFSDKRWSTGLDPLNDPHERFTGFGVPPAKQGDYSYLLHIVRSLKSTGKGACILPHGVLFRGNAEAEIRKNLIQRRYIKGIIGLPANLFYGTGIPACIIVVDKEGAAKREGLFMIDASQGFTKEGPKNRLRSQDIHRIVDVFNSQTDVPKYARTVPFAEIEKNEFNLNLPRYIDSQKAEDLQDIAGHLHGGIPAADIDALKDYWAVCPGLRNVLFSELRPGYLALKPEKTAIKSTIFEYPEFKTFITQMNAHFDAWKQKTVKKLKGIKAGEHPKELIGTLSEDLLHHYEGKSLIDAYDIYQHLMDYWANVMQDDCYLIAADGWKAVTYRILEKNKKGQEKDKGWACDLIPKQYLVARFFASEQEELTRVTSELESATSKKSELDEEHGSDGGALSDVSTKKDLEIAYNEGLIVALQTLEPDNHQRYENKLKELSKIEVSIQKLNEEDLIADLLNGKERPTQKALNSCIDEVTSSKQKSILNGYKDLLLGEKQLRKEIDEFIEGARIAVERGMAKEPNSDTYKDLILLNEYARLLESESELKKQVKEADASLDEKAYKHYPKLSEADTKSIVVEDKWLAATDAAIRGEMDRVSQSLTTRVKDLAERYEAPLPRMEAKVSELQAKVNQHLERMGFSWR